MHIPILSDALAHFRPQSVVSLCVNAHLFTPETFEQAATRISSNAQNVCNPISYQQFLQSGEIWQLWDDQGSWWGGASLRDVLAQASIVAPKEEVALLSEVFGFGANTLGWRVEMHIYPKDHEFTRDFQKIRTERLQSSVGIVTTNRPVMDTLVRQPTADVALTMLFWRWTMQGSINPSNIRDASQSLREMAASLARATSGAEWAKYDEGYDRLKGEWMEYDRQSIVQAVNPKAHASKPKVM